MSEQKPKNPLNKNPPPYFPYYNIIYTFRHTRVYMSGLHIKGTEHKSTQFYPKSRAF